MLKNKKMEFKKEKIKQGLFKDVTKHFEEPLFVVSIAAFLVAVLKSYANLPYATIMLLVLGISSVYFVYQYFKSEKNYWFFGVPILIFVTALFSFYGDTNTQFLRDFNAFTVIFGIYLFFYILSLHKIISKEIAAVFGIFISVLLLHLIPATYPYLTAGDAFDSHWHYKIVNNTYTGEHVPDKDLLVYPASEWKPYDGLDFSSNFFLHAVFMASTAKILEPFGINQYDTAMLFGGLMAGLTVILLYLFLREVLSEFKPYNYLVALIGSFALGFNFAYASRAVSGSDEASELGLLLMTITLLLVFKAFNEKSLKYTLLAGFSFFTWSIAWTGYSTYGINIVVLFTVLYAIIKFLHKENCFSHVPYIIIPVLFTFLSGFVRHAHNSMPVFDFPMRIVVPVAAAITIPVILEGLRFYIYKIKTENLENFDLSNKIEHLNYIAQKNTSIISIAFFVVAVIGFIVVGPSTVLNSVISQLSVEAQGVIYNTIAEAIRVHFDPVKYLFGGDGFNIYGIVFLYGVLMIPILAYFAIIKKSSGSLAILCIGAPAIYASFFKPQLVFDTSLAIVALGATVGLIAGINKKDLNGLRIIGTFAVIAIPFLTMPLIFDGVSGTSFSYFSSVIHPAAVIPHLGENNWDMSNGINWWMPALQWFYEKTDKNDTILTWWDYGHWLTPISERPVLIDNLQAIPWQLQEVARFFMMYQTEEEAMKIIDKYDVKYVVIDYTLIGKNQALHFIANGDLSINTPEYNAWLKTTENPNRKTYGVCSFAGVQTSPEKSENGGIEVVNKVFYQCGFPPNKTQMKDYIGLLEFDIGEQASVTNPSEISKYLKAVKVRGLKTTEDGITVSEEVSWDDWTKEHNSSILGLYSFGDIMTCDLMSQEQLKLQENYRCQFPMFRELVYAPDEFQNFMFTKLYLGDYAESYANMGLCKADWCKNISKRLENFRLIQDFNLGYTRIYEVARHCKDDSECKNNQFCDSTNHCTKKKKANELCSNNSECISNICENGICREAHLKTTGDKCANNSECLSNVCEDGICKEFSSKISEEVKKFEDKNAIIPACMKEVIPEKDKPKFYNCYINKEKEGVVNAQYALGSQLGVRGTPTLITGCDQNIISDVCSKVPTQKDSCKSRLTTNDKLECYKNGKIQIYEFTDLQCPYCYRTEPLIDELLNLSDVEMNINFFKIHGDPVHKEHIATMCAADVGKFREFESCAFDKYFKEGIKQVE